ncbi:general transcription factor 3C polypeptide 5-like isoform X2 [Acanthaster planci]|nr:general transcription factor 3C polypeptide 5-like isoform X2 [Acanthaster planci]
MKFRPDDPFCRSLYASKQPATSILLRVKKRYKKQAGSGSVEMESDSQGDDLEDEGKKVVQEQAGYQTELVGVIDNVYQFKGMCDFQYLPMQRNEETGRMESLIEKVIPTKPEDASFLKQDVPLFMLPPVFSRTDQASTHHYHPDVVPSMESLSYMVGKRLDKNIVGSGRARRPHNTYLVSFEQDSVPMAPHPDAMLVFEKGKERDNSVGLLRDELVQIFTKRPVWSRGALRHNCTLTDRQLSVLLPSVSYYFCNGPWRATWVRLGYDPRTARDGLKYQILDFRIRKSLYRNKLVMPADDQDRFRNTSTRRSMPASFQKPDKKLSTYVRPPKSKVLQRENRKALEKEAYFIFREGLVPAYNQMFYQLCDIDDEGVQAMIRAKSNSAGIRQPVRYLEQEVLDQMRSAMNEILKRTLEQEVLKRGVTTEGDEDTSSRSSTSQAENVGIEGPDTCMDDDEEEDIEDSPEDIDDNDNEDGPEDVDDNEDMEEDGLNMEEEDESENEMATELLEFFSGTS